MEKQTINKKRRRYKKKRILLLGCFVVLLLIASVFGMSKLLVPKSPVVVTKLHNITTANDLLGQIKIHQLSAEEEQIIADYQLVFNTLQRNDVSSYTNDEQTAITQQQQVVEALLAESDIENLEREINKLAYLIDEPLGADETMTYVRGILIMNKEYGAPASFQPGYRQITQQAFQAMAAAAKQEGINLYDFSNYRSYAGQESLYNRYVAADGEAAADRYSARPGKSEHQSGYVTDIGGDNQAAWAETTFDDTKEAAWLSAHAHEYGFIMRYLPGKEAETGYMHESWHFRYIGDIAPHVYTSGLSLEAYLKIV